MSKFYRLQPPSPELEYWGNSDLLAQIAYELKNNPNTCFSKNAFAWYNGAYALSENDFTDCRYQTEINESLCPEPEKPSSITDVINVLLEFSSGKNRRIALAALRIIFRETQRQLTENLAPPT